MTPQELTDPAASTESLAALLDKDDATNRLIARHPKAGATLLEKLSHSSDRTTRALVTANPDTPSAVYLRLGAQFPSEFLANPMLDLLFLERPALLQELPDTLLVQVLRRSNCPQDFLVWAASNGSEKVQLSVAMNAKAPQQAVEQLGSSIHAAVVEAVSHKQYMQVDAETAEPLFRQAVQHWLGALSFEDAKAAWAKHDIDLSQMPYLSTTVRRFLVTPIRLRRVPWDLDALNKAVAAAKAAVADDSFLHFKVEDPDRRVLSSRTTAKLAALCSGPYVMPERLARVSGSTDWLIRAAVARNAGTPPNVLRKLTADGHPLVAGLAKLALGRINQSPPEVESVKPGLRIGRIVVELISRLREFRDRRFSQDRIWGRLRTVSDVWVESKSALDYLRHQMDASEWERLWLMRAKDKEPERREELARRTDLPITALAVLARDEASEVRCAVAENTSTPLDLIAGLVKDRSVHVRSNVAKNPATPVALLATLVKSKDSNIRGGVAANPSTPVTMLEILANEEDNVVRCGVATNPSTPVAMLEMLANEEVDVVRHYIAGNPNTPVALLEKLAKDRHGHNTQVAIAKNPHTPFALLEVLARDTSNWVRQCVAGNPNTPVEVLKVLAKDKDEDVRYGVANNPNATFALLEELAKGEGSWDLYGVAPHPNTPVEVLKVLAKHKDVEVRSGVALHPNTPVEVLEALARDHFEWVRSDVAKNPKETLHNSHKLVVENLYLL